MKKIVGIIMAGLMMLTLCVPVSAAELAGDAPPTNVDIMRNGSFEEVTKNGNVTSVNEWEPLGGWEDEKVVSTTEEAHSGERSLKIKGSEDKWKHPWARIEISEGIIGGATLEFSFWYKGDFNEDGRMGIKFEEYTGTQIRADYGIADAEYYDWECKSEWTQITRTHKLAPNAQMAVFYVRLFKEEPTDFVYVDDIEIKMTELPEVSFEFSTDQVFYYTDMEQKEGQAQIEMNKYFKSDGYTAEFEFMDGNTVLDSIKTEFVDNKAYFNYSLDLISVKEKEYNIKARVKDPSGKVVEEYFEYAYKYDRPKAIDKNGVYRNMAGEIVRPIFMYHIGEEDWESASTAGINVVQYSLATTVEQTKADLDRLHELGMYAAVVCYWEMKPAGNDINYDRVYNYVSQIKDHPAIFCWMIMDEPFINDYYAHDDLRKSYIMLRSVDDFHPTYICEGSALRMSDVVKYTDIIGPDPYPGCWSSYGTYVPYFIDLTAKEAQKQNKPVYGILQCFTLGYLEGATPTAVQVHSMLMQAYLSGANGHGWYTWIPDRPEIDAMLDEGIYWPVMTNYYNLEADIIQPYYMTGEYMGFNVYKPGSVKEQTGDVWYETWTDGEVVYGIVQNRTGEDQSVDVSLTSSNGSVIIGEYEASIVYDGEGAATLTEGKDALNVALEPYQAITIKIDPKDDIDFSQMSAISDIADYIWAREAITFVTNKGIEDLGNDLAFRPGEQITRGDFAKFLMRTLDIRKSGARCTFADVNPDADYYTEVAIGQELGILKGTDGRNYNPEASITRQDLMVICARAMKFYKPLTAQSTDLSDKPDGDKVASYAVADVAAMLETGIIKGNDLGEINPLGNTTRAEAAVIMQRIFDWKNN